MMYGMMQKKQMILEHTIQSILCNIWAEAEEANDTKYIEVDIEHIMELCRERQDQSLGSFNNFTECR